MGILHKTGAACTAWLTAAMTLVAATPHFTCLCADGTLRPFCLGFDTGIPGTSCQVDCCAAMKTAGHRGKDRLPGDRDKSKCPFCHRHKPQTDQPNGRAFQVESTCCRRAPAQPAVYTAPQNNSGINQDLTMATLAPARNGLPAGLHSVKSFQTWRQMDLPPPPMDRIILLQHFTI